VTHPTAYRKAGKNKKAIIAFVLSLIGVLILPIVFSTIAIILAIVALNEIGRNPWEGGKGLAVAALVIGPLGFALGFALALLMDA
jgi:Na+/H+-dicarboxylate symporter